MCHKEGHTEIAYLRHDPRSPPMTGKIALVTDALHFIGESSAKALTDDGFTVLCHDEGFSGDKTRARFGAEHPRLVALEAQTPEDIRSAIETDYGRIDVLVNNDAYPAEKVAIDDVTSDILETTFNHLLFRPYLLTAALVPMMKDAKQGKIIFVSSAAPLRGLPNYSVYVTARGAANALAQTLAQELGRWNIQVNALAPNFVESPTYFPPSLMENPEVRNKILSRIPLGRLGKQEEAAAAVAFLASENASFITGHVIPFAGGWA